MIDRRRLRSNGRVAHSSLKGQVKADRFVTGEIQRIAVVIADLCESVRGDRERQLLRGEAFAALDVKDGYVFGYAEKDGYVGWLDGGALMAHPSEDPTHLVSVGHSYAKTTPGLKTMGQVTPLSFGTQLVVIDEAEGWSQVAWGRGTLPINLYVPTGHLSPLGMPESDPISVAERFLGTPYL